MPVSPPDAAPDVDDAHEDPSVEAGLSFRFLSQPSLLSSAPDRGRIGGTYDAVLDSATLVLTQVRIIGDAATGNSRTRVNEFALDWSADGTPLLRFPQAPPGIYAKLLGRIDAYRIEGRVIIDSREQAFVIDESGSDAELSFDLEGLSLEPGMDRTITVMVDLSRVVSAIEWSQVDADIDGALVVDDESMVIESARETLEDAFGKGDERDDDSGDDGSGDDGGGDDGDDGDKDDGSDDRDDGEPTTGGGPTTGGEPWR